MKVKVTEGDDLNVQLAKKFARLARASGTTSSATIRHSTAPARKLARRVRRELGLPANATVVVVG